jgi:hypothetical protein
VGNLPVSRRTRIWVNDDNRTAADLERRMAPSAFALRRTGRLQSLLRATKVGAPVERRGIQQAKNPPLATGPNVREDKDLRSIRECAVCCKLDTQRNSASNLVPGYAPDPVSRNGTITPTKAQRDRGGWRRGSLAACSASRHGSGMIADKNSGARDQHGDHSGERQEFHYEEFHCQEFHFCRPLREVDSRSRRES